MEENNQAKNSQDPNWLISTWLVIICSFILIAFTLLAVIMSGSFNPVVWNKQITFIIIYFSAMWGISIIGYMEQAGKISIFKEIENLFEIDEYKNKKPLDVFFSHYANVATIGLLLALSIYTYKSFPVENAVGGFLMLIGIVLIIVAIVCFYVLFLLRLATKLTSLKNPIFYIAILLTAFFVDGKAFEMMIKGVPSIQPPSHTREHAQ